MYIRMTGGRDRGEVRDFNFEDAQVLIKNGHAVSVNFNETDPLGKRSDLNIPDVPAELGPPQVPLIPARTGDEPAVIANKNGPVPSAQKSRKKF